jgi:hypothetical protein
LCKKQVEPGHVILNAVKDLVPAMQVVLECKDEILLTFYNAPTQIEQDLYLSWMEYRQRAFQGAFHNSPDYMHWYGWAPLNQNDFSIQTQAEELRAAAAEAE